jgi:uncharacterized protein YndB with AHSA1/START domain
MTETMTEEVAEREIVITRIFDTPRERVWLAWTQPEELTRWWGKRGWTAPLETITMDVRPGGVFRLTNVRDEDGAEMPQSGVYREVVEPERLVFAEGADAGCPDAEQTVTVVTFTDLGDGRTEMVLHSRVHTTEANSDQMAGGVASALERLADHLA